MSNTVQFTSEALRLVNRIGGATAVGLRVQLVRAIDLENQLTVSHIAQRYMSHRGPDTLGVVTNRLRSSLRASKARVARGMIISSIGSNVRYMRPHEYGFDGNVQVAAYTRRDDRFNVLRVQTGIMAAVTDGKGRRGKPGKVIAREQKIFEMRTGKILPGDSKTKLVAQGVVRVRAHSRHVHFAERAPIRRGITDRIADYNAALERAAVGYISGGAS